MGFQPHERMEREGAPSLTLATSASLVLVSLDLLVLTWDSRSRGTKKINRGGGSGFHLLRPWMGLEGWRGVQEIGSRDDGLISLLG